MNCAVCGAAFIPQCKSQRYCSVPCRNRRPKVPQRPWRERSRGKRQCLWCGAEFDWYPKYRETFCSKACAANGHIGAKVEWRCGVPWRICTECSTVFVHRGRGLACSDDCRKAKARRRFQETFVPKVGPPVLHTCRMCGVDFTSTRYSAVRRFCSVRCGDRWQATRPAAIARARLKREDRAAFIAAGEDFANWEIFVRDGWMCHICGQRVPRKKWPHPLAPTIDHLVPVTAKGAHTRRNVRLAHFMCNSRRREVGPAQLILFGDVA